MVQTHDEASEQGSGGPNDGGEWDTTVDIDFDGEQLEEQWRKVMSILSTEGRQDMPGVPDSDPDGRLQDPGFDINLDNLDNRGLLAIMVRSNLAVLRTLFDIANSTQSASVLNITGVQQVDEAERAKEIVPSAGTEAATTKSIIIRADTDNQAPIYIGDDTVNPTQGYKLRKGEFLTLDFDFSQSSLFMTASEEGPEIQVLGFR